MKRKWLSNFLEFMNPSVETPRSLRHQVLQQIQKKLSPSFFDSFQKFFASQALAGVATLFICPQFGSGFTKDGGHHFIHVVMSYGHWACAAFCATVFMGFGSVIALLVLSQSEMSALRQKAWLSIGIPPLAYLMVFIVMRNKNELNSEYFIQPEYIVTWYGVAVLIVTTILFSRSKQLPTRV